MLDGVGLRRVVRMVGMMVRMVGMMVRVGGRRREGHSEREGGILSLYILRVVPRRIDIGCMPHRELPSRHAGALAYGSEGGGSHGSLTTFLAPAPLRL